MVGRLVGVDDDGVKGSLDRNALNFKACVRVLLANGDQVLVQFDGLVQPLPSLVKAIGAGSNRDAIATQVYWHSFRAVTQGPQ